ncbi:Hypothetical predicted protein [Mytilus galloprovincialis]|uniref:Uncharacterized protein n=1 Tax=Mytilus galloprovincialis TaxID=29158 RepID=A0A8B6E824_MYTGA|nr:Hypothetical predicted protein [Mytilus galloprovincialis]
MLRSMLWTGLKTSLKDLSGHKYDTIKTFDALRVAIRHIEGDHLLRESSHSSKPHTSKAATDVKEAPSEIEELKGMIHQLVNRMDTYETNKQTPPWQQQQSQQAQQQHWQQQQPPWQQQQHWQQGQPWNGHQQATQHAYTVASEASKKSQLRQKEGYDTKVRGATIQKGDRVLVKIVAFGEGKHKLADKWEHDPYTVLAQPNADIPVFTVQKENATDMEAEGTETESVFGSASTVSSEDSSQEDSPDEASTAVSPEPVRRLLERDSNQPG